MLTYFSTPNETLSASLARLGLVRAFSSICMAAPSIERICCRLADWIGETLPAKNGESLLDVCLAQAVGAWQAVAPESAGTALQMRAFVIALMSSLSDLNLVTVVGKNKKVLTKWDPLRDGSLRDWLDAYAKDGVEVVQSPLTGVSDAAVRLVMLARLVDLSDVEWIEGVPGHPYATNDTRGNLPEVLS